MKKSFKEFRMTLVCAILFILCLALALYCGMNHQMRRLIIALVLSFIALMMLTTRFRMIFFDDGIMIYQWKIMTMLPSFIDYKDIESMEQLSKHRVLIRHHLDTVVYVFNSEAFIEAYMQVKHEDH
ncbi:MAG: hypothetical protein LUG12_00695 [Erysipelotrichaceae bacterium]|nr:hypothetical protein [Erysipelotrichaceae bacterium]